MNDNRFLSPTEIKYWKEKLEIMTYDPMVKIDHYTSIRKINYTLSISVSDNNIERYENLLDRFLENGARQVLYEAQKHYYQNFYVEDLVNFKKFESRSKHRTYDVDFTRITYSLKNQPMLASVFFLQIVKDVVNIIGNFWQFNESGQEICLIKYPVGSIVSMKNDNSDFFVESVNFVRENTEMYKAAKEKFGFAEELLLYNLLRIESNLNSQVLQFSETITTSSDFIRPNRDQRINDVLK
jgi:hypothetical protein